MATSPQKTRTRSKRVAVATNVRVHHPRVEGELVLRTDANWERNLAPLRADREIGVFEFHVPAERTHSYFKPVVMRDGVARWAQGENDLLCSGSRNVLDVWPYFDPDDTCHVCTARVVPDAISRAGYEVRVFLPRGYDENTLERFPVVYMHDGHNLFFPEESFSGETWKVQETLRVLQSMSLTRKVIVVGVHTRDRMRDYTQAGYDAYGRMLTEHLKVWVDANYRTLSESENTAVFGSSLGGVASLHLAWTHPDVFGRAACLSSTFGYADDLLERVRSEKRRDIELYLDSGWPNDNYEATRSMRNALVARGFVEGRDLHYLAFPSATHSERSWAMRVHVPFQLFFGERAAR